MPNYAHATIIGHLGRDPEIRHTPDGSPVASFSMATSRKRNDQEITTWWRVSLFGRRAEVLAQHLHKGDPVLVSGEPFQREWEDKDGNTRVGLELAANDFAFIGSGKKTANEGSGTPSARAQAPADFDDAIPF